MGPARRAAILVIARPNGVSAGNSKRSRGSFSNVPSSFGYDAEYAHFKHLFDTFNPEILRRIQISVEDDLDAALLEAAIGKRLENGSGLIKRQHVRRRDDEEFLDVLQQCPVCGVEMPAQIDEYPVVLPADKPEKALDAPLLGQRRGTWKLRRVGRRSVRDMSAGDASRSTPGDDRVTNSRHALELKRRTASNASPAWPAD